MGFPGHWLARSAAAGTCAALMVWMLGCGKEDAQVTSSSSKFKVAKDGTKTTPTNLPAEEAPEAPPKTLPPSLKGKNKKAPQVSPETMQALESGELPDDPEQMLGLLQMLEGQKPRGRTEREQLQDIIQMQKLRSLVADKLYNSKVDDKTRYVAAQAKLSSLTTLSQFRDPESDEARQKFAETMVSDKFPPIAQLGRFLQFGSYVDEFATEEAPESGSALVEKVAALLKSDGDSPVTAQIVGQAAQILESKDFRDDAVKVLNLAAETFRKSDDSELADVGNQLGFNARLLQANIGSLLQKAMKGEAEDRTAFVEAFAKLAQSGPADENLLQIANKLIGVMEATQNFEVAKGLVAALDEAYQKVEDEKLKESATKVVAKARQRHGLIGQELPVEGNLLNGEKFDWSAYKGKVVLLDFWATWCGPCLEEIPNILQNYETYKDRGFDVVGINLDDDVADVKQFLTLQKLPWTTIVSADPAAVGMDTPLAVHCGVAGIPFIALIGKDGKVDSIQLRGPALAKRLAEIFPDEDSEKGDGKPAEKPATERPADEKPADEKPAEKKAE